mgnify:CR=1 FL=1
MARPRMYRHDCRCPHCGSNCVIKYGKANGRQTFRCRECAYRFMPGATRHVYPERVRQEALRMYCEGTGIEAISRVLGVKSGTVYSWVKKSQVGTVDGGASNPRAAEEPTGSGDLSG